MRREIEINGFKALLELKNNRGKIRFDGREFDVEILDKNGNEFLISVSGEKMLVRLIDDYVAFINGRLISFEYIERPPIKRVDGRTSRSVTTYSKEFLLSPLAGRVVEVLAKNGDKVSKGDTLVVLESMKMLIEVKSDRDGKIEEVLVKRGDVVNKGQPLVKFLQDEK